MPKTYSWRFKVRTYELDQFGHVNNVNYISYLEEAATQASAAAGYPIDWYWQNGYIWLIRKWTIRYYQTAVYGDELEAVTWVSDLRRVRSNREYVLNRVGDGEKVVRARTDWVYVNAETHQPARIPDHFQAAFQPPNEPLEDLGVRIRNATPTVDAHRYVTHHDVRTYEIDPALHVNNAMYLRWIEHAYANAVTTAGWSFQRQLQEYNFAIFAGGHEIEYFKPAKEGDRIKIISWVTEMARVRGAWIHEVRNADTDELLARDYAVGAFVDLSDGQPKPARIPDPLLQAVLSGGSG